MSNKHQRPADGGSYRRKKDGTYQRLDQPQQQPGRKPVAATVQSRAKPAAGPAKADKDNVRPMRSNKE